MTHHETNRWKGFVVGILGSVAGLLAMRYYWNNVAPMLKDKANSQSGNKQQQQQANSLQELDSIAIFGKQYKDDESATAALGRMLYSRLNGQEPQSEETKTALSYLVHWGYGMYQGGNYGAWRSDAGFPDLRGGLIWGAGLWLVGDELMVPLLGLQQGPGAVPPVQHANRLGAHLAYGLATAATTQLLRKML